MEQAADELLPSVGGGRLEKTRFRLKSLFIFSFRCFLWRWDGKTNNYLDINLIFLIPCSFLLCSGKPETSSRNINVWFWSPEPAFCSGSSLNVAAESRRLRCCCEAFTVSGVPTQRFQTITGITTFLQLHRLRRQRLCINTQTWNKFVPTHDGGKGAAS